MASRRFFAPWMRLATVAKRIQGAMPKKRLEAEIEPALAWRQRVIALACAARVRLVALAGAAGLRAGARTRSTPASTASRWRCRRSGSGRSTWPRCTRSAARGRFRLWALLLAPLLVAGMSIANLALQVPEVQATDLACVLFALAVRPPRSRPSRDPAREQVESGGSCRAAPRPGFAVRDAAQRAWTDRVGVPSACCCWSRSSSARSRRAASPARRVRRRLADLPDRRRRLRRAASTGDPTRS